MPSLDRNTQDTLFETPEPWSDYWQEMPEFLLNDLSPQQSIIVHFKDISDRKQFATLIGQTITSETKSIWFPKAQIGRIVDKCYTTKQKIKHKYPIYIPSKGRWESRLTVKALDKIYTPYRVVVEPQEYDNYAAVIAPHKILVLPFSNQGLHTTRTWILEHSLAEGYKRHWQLDDNITGFYRFNRNFKLPVSSAATFKAIEDFVDRYENIDLAGMNYFMFAKRKYVIPPITWNTRIYSCTLVNNNQPERWTSYFNDDTDISLRVLLKGRCTALFNAFLCYKMTTMTIQGGLTDDYQGDGRYKMALALKERHPHLTKITKKFGRYQHHVDYSVFKKNKPILISGKNYKDEINNYGMELEIQRTTNED